mmetsp:Transcript_15145/g.43242  ORF Transcript_15145/g.43242 Transcript_15145/m.43242 type:complete len:485 (+) Transcript_15145:62-1516(+)
MEAFKEAACGVAEAASLQTWPDALHLVLLRHLGSAQDVQGYLWPYCTLCRVCQSAVLQPSLWREIDLSESELPNLTTDNILSLVRHGGQQTLERLSLRGLAQLDDDTLVALAELLDGGSLKALDLGGCPGLSGGALLALQSLPALEELGVKYLASLEDAHIQALCLACPRLRRLDVRFCEWLQDVSALLRSPGTWVSLQLDGCFRLDVGLLLAESPGSWRSLEELSLDGEELGAEQLASVATACPRLRYLAVSFARELDAAALGSLSSLSQLEALTLRKAIQPGDADWVAFVLEQRAARARARSPAEWRELNFSECELFSDGAALALAAVPLPALLDLDLSWCWHLSDAGLSSLLSVAPELRRVKLAGMKALSARGLVPCCRLYQLVELDCTACNSVPDSLLELLHRLFAAPPGTDGEALPPGPLPPRLGRCAEELWCRRRRGTVRLLVKNYYAEYLQDWVDVRTPRATCCVAESLLDSFGEFG